MDAAKLGQLLEREDSRKTLVNYWFETMGGGWVRPDWTAIAQAAIDFYDPTDGLAEVELLRAAVARVRAKHVANTMRSCMECEQHYPCPTVRALDGET